MLCWVAVRGSRVRLAQPQERMAELASTSSMMGEVRGNGVLSCFVMVQLYGGSRRGLLSCRSVWRNWPAPAA
jgi:hypothetical protein